MVGFPPPIRFLIPRAHRARVNITRPSYGLAALVAGAIVLALLRSSAAAASQANVRGNVVSVERGEPIAGVVITAAEFGISTRTGGDGAFTFVVDLQEQEPLPTMITASAPGYGEWTIEGVWVVPGDTLLLDVELGSSPTRIVVPEPRSGGAAWPAAQLAQGFQGGAATSQLELPLPPTIRVRVTGYPYCDTEREYTVETIDFKEYAKHVLPNEWVPAWPHESLRAGAMAVKMYAWSYIAVGGKWSDADVYDSTCDQVYIPSVSYLSTNNAIDFTWNWRLTRTDQLLRTFYRAYESQCEVVGLSGNCMGQIESRDMAYDRYTWDEILFDFYDDAALSTVWNPPGGYSLRFFGNGYGDLDRVKIPIDPPVPADVGTTDLTLEWWMKALPSENPSSHCSPGGSKWFFGNTIFDRDTFGDGDFGDYGVSLAGGRIAFGVGRGSEILTICGTSDLADGQWHHVAVTRSQAGGMRIFVDGTLEATGTGPAGDITYRDGRSTTWANDPYLVIGAEKNDLDNAVYPSYSGWLDEIRISDSIRYSANFTPPENRFATDQNTVALYHLNEGVGNYIADSSGASGGPSVGVRSYGGVLNGPEWTVDTFWYVPPPTPTPTNTPTPEPTQSPTIGPSPTPSGTGTQTSTPTPTSTATPTMTASPSATEPSSTATPTSTVEPSSSPIPEPTATLTVEPSSTPTPEPTPTSTIIPPSTATTEPSPTAPPPTTTPQPTAPSQPSPTPTGEPTKGDLNGDGSVNVLDVQLCVNVVLGVVTDPVIVSAADINQDGEVNVLDVQRIANIVLSG